MTDIDPSADPNADPGPDRSAALAPSPDPHVDPTPPRSPRPTGPIQYKGEELDAQRGPGLGCFRFQLLVLVALIVLTPLTVVWKWPEAISAVFLFAVILLLLFTGQTIIFLLRLVAADRRGRRRPLGSATKTVGELEDAGAGEIGDQAPGPPIGAGAASTDGADPPEARTTSEPDADRSD